MIAAVLVLGGAAMGWAAGRPRPPLPRPLALDRTGVEGSPTLRDSAGRILLANLRVVEPGRLYRASSFPVNAQRAAAEGPVPAPAALLGPELFEFLRARNVRDVVTLDPADRAFWAEQGYYRFWAERTGYTIELTRWAVPAAEAYARHDRSGLRAGASLVVFMRGRTADQGAVLVHGDAGKDAVGVAVAVYETWRNQGWIEPSALWGAVTGRYLMSNRLLRETGPLAGRPTRCASGREGYVCPEWLSALRKDVEYIAKL